MTNCDVSIIIPVYNVKLYLRKCIESVLAQTYENFEIILIDDGSTDGSSEICDEYAKNNNRIRVKHQQNNGISSARNLGIKESKGEFIQFIDSDDYVSPIMLENMVKAIKSYNADMVICEYYNIFSNGKKQKHYDDMKSIKVIDQVQYTHLSILDREVTDHLWRRLMRKKLVINLLFPQNMNFEDIYVSADITKNIKKVVILNNAYYYYRINENGTVKNISLKNFVDHFIAVKNKLYMLKDIVPVLGIEIDKALVTNTVAIYGDLIREHMMGSRVKEFKKELIKEIKNYPLYYVNGRLNKVFTFTIIKCSFFSTFCYMILHLIRKDSI